MHKALFLRTKHFSWEQLHVMMGCNAFIKCYQKIENIKNSFKKANTAILFILSAERYAHRNTNNGVVKNKND